MDDYLKKRIDMVVVMIAALTGMSESDIEKAVEGTIVYRNLLNGEECTLYEDYSANIMEMAEELREKNIETAISKITSKAVADLNRWMTDRGIVDAVQMREKMPERAEGEEELDIGAKVVRVLTAKWSEVEAGKQDKILAWMDGAKKLLKTYSGQPPIRWNSESTAVAGTRGMKGRQSDCVDMILFDGREDGYHFRLSQRLRGRFIIENRTDDGEPVCLVIMGCDDTSFSGIYDLSLLGDRWLRTKKMELPAGEYMLYIPIGD